MVLLKMNYSKQKLKSSKTQILNKLNVLVSISKKFGLGKQLMLL